MGQGGAVNLAWQTGESRGLAWHTFGWLCPRLAERAGGIPAWPAVPGPLVLGSPLAGSRCIPALAGERWVLLRGGEGSLAEPCLAFLSQLSAAPPSLSWVLLVYELAGCCGGPTSGRLTKGPHKSVREDGMAGRGWASNGCPEAAAATASSLEMWLSCISACRSGRRLPSRTVR